MPHAIRSSLKLNAALSALLVGCPAAAWAQDNVATVQNAAPESTAAESQAQEEGLQEIVVTARRVTENLQDVPISVGAINQDTLVARGITSLVEVKSAVANTYISKTAVAGGQYISIRGITGQSIPNVSADSNIGLYIDGVYIARQQSAGSDIADLQRLEVLRGPQGTLAGRNSAAGAINFVTASPTGEFGVIAEGTVGNFGRYRGRVTVNTPEVAGFSARITYVHDQNRGTQRNLAGGTTYDYGPEWGKFTAANRVDSLNSDTVMAKLRYRGIEGLNVEYKFDFTDQVEVFPGSFTVGFPTSFAGSVAAAYYLAQPPGTVPLTRGRPEYQNQDMLSPAKIKTFGHTLTATLDISDDVTAKSITAYRDVETLQQGDVDGLAFSVFPATIFPFTGNPICIACSLVRVDQHQFSQELQLIGKVSKLDYILGAYYFREKAFGDNTFSFFKDMTPGPDGIIPIVNTDYSQAGTREEAKNISYALYGHVEYPILENLEVALGARYTIDKRSSLDLRPHLAAPVLDKVKFKRFNYDAALTYFITDDINVYARYATGYQSGGVMKQEIFEPEDHKAIEAGFKSEFLDRKVRLNAAVYHTKIKNLQRAGVGPTGLIITNFPRAKISGVEMELLVRPTRGLTLGANYGYNKLTSANVDVPLAPRHNASFSAQYDTPESSNGMYFSFRMDGDYRSKTYGSGMLNEAERAANPAFPLPAGIWAGFPSQQAYLDDLISDILGGGYWLFNARASVIDLPLAGTKARVTAYVRNLTDKEGRNYVVNNSLFQNAYERPRTYGLEVSFEF